MALRLRAMTAAEFERYRARAIEEYARAHVEAGNWDPADAHERAARETDEHLPDGVETEGMRLLVAESGEGKTVGWVWVSLREPDRQGAWIYDIEIAADKRGQGYGRALLEATERVVGEAGVATIGLNVFGENTVARRLYQSAGYETKTLQMSKRVLG
jgi:ribosomal protein S18 acetylase RimI-like enzyme